MNPVESAAVDGLVVSHDELLHLPTELRADGDSGAFAIDLQSDVGLQSSVAFLSKLEAAADALKLPVAPRGYRTGFSVNYRALFPDGGRHYRVDILEASLDSHQTIWVNGDKFELSEEAVGFAVDLQRGLAMLGNILGCCRAAASGARPPQVIAVRNELAAALTSVDTAWAGFESKYIADLIAIEDQARQLVVRAVEAEKCLRRCEAMRQQDGSAELAEEHEHVQCKLVEQIAKLNAVANHKRKGRDDLSSDILKSALQVHKSGNASKIADSSSSSSSSAAAQVLADDIVGAFEAIRKYLREVNLCLERVDPHLCNNNGLVARLCDWEESWEVGGRYVRCPLLRAALCDVVAKICDIQRLMPSLRSMIEECDVELFLVLPRIVLLCFLADPTGKQAEFMKLLLPHRFPGGSGADAELQGMTQQFHQAMRAVGAGAPGADAKAFAWEVVVRHAVDGFDGRAMALEGSPIAKRAEVQRAIDTFSQELERWSMELQRHCPEDWNQCSSVLVQCLTGASKRQTFSPKFQV